MKEHKITTLGQSCTGCGACANVCPKRCIQMQADSEGFPYPAIDEAACVHCGVCDKTCPALQSANLNPVIRAVALLHDDTAVWEASSSGGAFSALCAAFFQRYPNGRVYGAAFDENNVVYHRGVGALSEIGAFRKSKYVQSEIRTCYQQAAADLSAGTPVLFSGTPCQIAGLKAVVRPEDQEKLYCVDLVCHGVGSPKVFQRHLEELEKTAGSRLKTFRFRMRKVRRGIMNWYCTESTYQNGKTLLLERDTYVKLFIAGLCLRPSCGSCRYAGTQRTGDLSLGDLKGKFDLYPEDRSFTNWSAVLCNTQKGMELLEPATQLCHVKDLDISRFVHYSAPLKRANALPPQRSAFFKLFLEGNSLDACMKQTMPPQKLSVKLWCQLPERLRAGLKRALHKTKGSL